ncbi:hypothetical protein NIES4074_07260 [Cylindrospermum sp. NIES-4074]|nr:hypothetical protein NIES4074_07260 [Cylindrospermum sp. NIES-4074]
MILIKELVQKALTAGYLSATDQKQIRSLLQGNYDSEDLDAFILLQRAVAAGEVKRESCSPKASLSAKGKDASSNIKAAYQIAAEMAYAAALALTQPKNSHDQPSLGA